MKIISTLILFFLLNPISLPQQFKYERSFGEFKNATAFYINAAGVVFVTDDITDAVYQLDTLGNVFLAIGGYGWEIDAFDDPVDIFADALKVLVADRNNNRIQRFDKNLNFIFEFKTEDNDIEAERFRYPLSAAPSNLGDVFILDSDNLRIVKFDLFGNYLQDIGGYDYGSYVLSAPKQLAISMDNNLYVIDGNNIFIFDNYGTALGLIEAEEELRSIRIIFNWLTTNTKEIIYFSNLRSREQNLIEAILTGYEEKLEIVSSLIFNKKLYVLTPTTIHIFSPL
ncbi:MAG: NHL repeat-containing protein [Ignavibacterium sp.]|nr:MAG: NHL repeat-containing protein [Ignavibacterium sp.]